MLIQSTKPLRAGDVCRADGYIFAVPGADEAWMNCGEPLNDVPHWTGDSETGVRLRTPYLQLSSDRDVLDPYLAYSISGIWDGEALADDGRLWVCSVQDPTRANELDLVVRLLSDAPASGSVSAHSL